MNNIINLDLVGTETLLLELREKKKKVSCLAILQFSEQL